MNEEKAVWMEDRVNAIMAIVEDHPDILPAMKDYIALVSYSQAVPREMRQKALLKPISFAHDLLVNLSSAVAFEEFDDDRIKYADHELRARIAEDIVLETLIVAEHEQEHGAGRA